MTQNGCETGFSLLENAGVENDVKQTYSLYLGFLLKSVEVENNVKTDVCIYIYGYFTTTKMAAENGWLVNAPTTMTIISGRWV